MESFEQVFWNEFECYETSERLGIKFKRGKGSQSGILFCD